MFFFFSFEFVVVRLFVLLTCLQYNSVYDVMVSSDNGGVIEYWNASDYGFPSNLDFRFKSETDLFEFAKVYYCNSLLLQQFIFFF